MGGESIPPSSEVKKWLEPISAYAFQLEVTPDTGRLHWQGWARNQNAKTFKQWQGFLPGAHIEQQKARFSQKASDYCCKENTRAKHDDVLALGWSPEEIGPHLKGVVMPGPAITSELNDQNMYPWQRSMIEMYEGPVHSRGIEWVWEAEGNTGKSALAKHMAILGHTLVVSGKAEDVACGVSRWITPEAGKPPPKPLRLIIWDVPRCNNGHLSYQAMENVKNGCFYSGKYESGMVLMEKPHVWVFANCTPELEKLSRDRWAIYTIKDKCLVHLEPVWGIFPTHTRKEGHEDVERAKQPSTVMYVPKTMAGGGGGGGGGGGSGGGGAAAPRMGTLGLALPSRPCQGCGKDAAGGMYGLCVECTA